MEPIKREKYHYSFRFYYNMHCIIMPFNVMSGRNVLLISPWIAVFWYGRAKWHSSEISHNKRFGLESEPDPIMGRIRYTIPFSFYLWSQALWRIYKEIKNLFQIRSFLQCRTNIIVCSMRVFYFTGSLALSPQNDLNGYSIILGFYYWECISEWTNKNASAFRSVI